MNDSQKDDLFEQVIVQLDEKDTRCHACGGRIRKENGYFINTLDATREPSAIIAEFPCDCGHVTAHANIEIDHPGLK